MNDKFFPVLKHHEMKKLYRLDSTCYRCGKMAYANKGDD